MTKPTAFQPGLLRRMDPPPEKIVILRASRIGDFLNAQPAFRAIKFATPNARVSLITVSSLMELAHRLPMVDEVFEFPGYPGLAEQLFNPVNTVEFFSLMQTKKFDLAIQLQGTGVHSNPFMLMLGARATAGFIRSDDPPGLLNAALPWPETGHEIDRVLSLPTFLGAGPASKQIIFPISTKEHHTARQWLAPLKRPLIGLHTNARDLTRRWSLVNFVHAARQLSGLTGGSIILLGEPGDGRAFLEETSTLSGSVVDLSGKTTITMLGAVLAELDLFITNDTGPAHIAYALNTPTLTIFGSGDPTRNGPMRPGPFRLLVHPVECRPCEYTHCPIGFACLNAISVENVVSQAVDILKNCA